MSNDKFNFFVESSVPEDIYKAAINKKDDSRYDNMIVEGIASTSDKDKQGEELVPDGYDISSFLAEGMVNLEHFTSRKGGAEWWIGHPIDARVRNNEFYIKAKLWKGQKHAQDLWDTLLAMKKNKVPRKLGWSIEGSKLETDPINKKRITKAKINHVCLTFSPVNANTYADISKGNQSEDYVDYKFETDKTTHGGKEVLLEVEENGKRITIDKDFKVTIKSMDLEATKPLRKESLKKKVYDLKNLDVIIKNYKSGNISESIMETFRENFKKNLILR